MTAALAQVPVEQLDHYWRYAEPYLRRVHEKTHCDPPSAFYERLKAKKCDLWFVAVDGVLKAAFITSKSDDRLAAEVMAGDDMNEWFHDALAQLEDLARQNGIKRIVMESRRGIAAQLPDYRPIRVVIEKVL